MKLAESQGAVLAGRAQAIELREDLEAELAMTGGVVLDFEDVEAISPSFADEIFGKFVDNVGADRVTFANLSDEIEAVAKIVRRNGPRAV